jgi:hypothetical protein
MEFARRALIGERALAAVALAAALGAAWAEAGTTLAQRRNDGRPWLAWVEARERGSDRPPALLLADYDPSARRLSLLHVPGAALLEPRRTVERAYLDALAAGGDDAAAARAAEDLAEARLRALSPESIPAVSGRLGVELAPRADEDEPAAEAALALKAAARSPRGWARLLRGAARGLARGDRAALEPLLFELELRRVSVENVEAARLPDDALAPDLLGRFFASAPPPDDGRAVTVEILNATPEPGLASRAAKMLKSKGIDVLALGAARARTRTLVYDRVGVFRRAAFVRAALDCPTARAVTRVDPARAVDVSVELGSDCAAAPEPNGSRRP